MKGYINNKEIPRNIPSALLALQIHFTIMLYYHNSPSINMTIVIYSPAVELIEYDLNFVTGREK